MDTTPLSQFAARPGQSMEEHLRGVDELGQLLTTEAGTTPYGDDWQAVLEAIAWTHDIGKLTEYFQAYIETGDRTAVGDAHLTYHGTFGGLVTALALMERGFSAETTAAGFYAVAKHHSVLGNFHNDITDYYSPGRVKVDDVYEMATTQLQSITDTAPTAANVALENATNGNYSWAELVDDGLERARATIQHIAKRGDYTDDEWYGCVLKMWSTLVTADKMDASGLSQTITRTPDRPDITNLSTEIRDLSQTTLPNGESASVYIDDPSRPLPDDTATMEQRLAAIRTATNARVTDRLTNSHDQGERVFELTLPTGFGKTYTGLRAALHLANKQNSRVVYALPYTSIIDQVDDNVREIFGLSPEDKAYTKHHHLADTRTTLSEENNTDSDGPSSGRETLHAEAWQSGLVLTTFTQLLESVSGPENIQSTKLPSLQDAVILIDEPQAISMEWWGLFGRLTTYLTNEYNATIVIMTATQPRIFDQLPYTPDPTPLTDLTTEATDLIAENPRVSFDLHDSLLDHFAGGGQPLSIQRAAAEIENTTTPTEDTLSIHNTVESAATLTESLLGMGAIPLGGELTTYWRKSDRSEFDPEEYLDHVATTHPNANMGVITLSTRQRPRDRIALIETIDTILDPTTETPFDTIPTITVSTQLIEAGVDLSFDRLYRDYAPLPSIVQAAGRCNRRFNDDSASVTIWRLAGPDEEDYIPSQLIYHDTSEQSLLVPTEKAIQQLYKSEKKHDIPEATMIREGVQQYYTALHNQRRTGARTDALVSAFNNAQGDILRDASLVSSDYPTKDYLVLITETEIELYDEYHRHRENQEWSKAREAFQQLKQTLVSVPVSNNPETKTPEPIRVSQKETIYSVTTGRGISTNDVRSDSEI